MNVYCRLQDVVAAIQGSSQWPAHSHDAELLRLMEEISREAERHCNLVFAAVTDTRYFDGNGCGELWLPPSRGFLAAAPTAFAVDLYGRLDYLASPVVNTDYFTYPADSTPGDPQPIMRLDVNPWSTLLVRAWPRGRRALRITGRFGWSEETEATGVTVNDEDGGLDASETAMTVSGAGLQAGDTLLVGSEQIYVSAAAGATSTALTVVRGVNGTTAATHANGAAILRRRYPRPVEQVVLARTIQRFKRQEVGYVSTIANSEIGTFNLYRGTDADFDRALAAYSFPEAA